MPKLLKGQLTIPIPNRIGFKRSTEELFAEEYGAEKLAEQQRLYVEARACTCAHLADNLIPDRWGTRYGHKPPCPRAGKKF